MATIDDRMIQEIEGIYHFYTTRAQRICVGDAGDLLRIVGLNPTNAVISKVTRQFDNAREMPLDMFVVFLQDVLKDYKPHNTEEIIEGFRQFDRDCSGYLDSAQIRHYLLNIGEKLSEKEVRQLFANQETAEGLINFESCDRAGKSTQLGKLSDGLVKHGVKVEKLHFPDRSTPTGGVINDYLEGKLKLEDHCIHLLFSANRWETVSRLTALLESGTSVLCDRYAYSGVAFSAAKPGMDLEWCRQPDVGLPKPDIVFYLDISPEAQAKRQGFGDECYDRSDFQLQVRNMYMQLKEKESHWTLIDADSDPSIIAEKILDKTLLEMENLSLSVGKLWTKADC